MRWLTFAVCMLLAVSAALYVALATSTLHRVAGALLCAGGIGTAWSLRPGTPVQPSPLSVALRRVMYVSTAALVLAGAASIVVESTRPRPVAAEILWEVTVVLFAASLGLNAWVTSPAREAEPPAV